MDSAQAPNKEDALHQWMGAYGDGLLRICYLYLSDYHLAEDALQETFLQAYIHFDDFRGNSSPKTWLTRIALNASNGIRRTSWFRHIDRREIPEKHETPTMPDNAMIAEIGKLPDKLRQVVILFYYEEMRQREIAAFLKISESAVSVRLSRARAKLKERLRKEEWS